MAQQAPNGPRSEFSPAKEQYLPREIRELVIEHAVDFFDVKGPLYLMSRDQFQYLLCAHPALVDRPVRYDPRREQIEYSINNLQYLNLRPGRYVFKKGPDYTLFFREDQPELRVIQNLEDLKLDNNIDLDAKVIIDQEQFAQRHLDDYSEHKDRQRLRGSQFRPSRSREYREEQEYRRQHFGGYVIVSQETLEREMNNLEMDYCQHEIPSIADILKRPYVEIPPEERYYVTKDYILFDAWEPLLTFSPTDTVLVTTEYTYAPTCVEEGPDGRYRKLNNYGPECELKWALYEHLLNLPEMSDDKLEEVLGLKEKVKKMRFNLIVERLRELSMYQLMMIARDLPEFSEREAISLLSVRFPEARELLYQL